MFMSALFADKASKPDPTTELYSRLARMQLTPDQSARLAVTIDVALDAADSGRPLEGAWLPLGSSADSLLFDAHDCLTRKEDFVSPLAEGAADAVRAELAALSRVLSEGSARA